MLEGEESESFFVEIAVMSAKVAVFCNQGEEVGCQKNTSMGFTSHSKKARRWGSREPIKGNA